MKQKQRAILFATVGVAFAIYSCIVIAEHGFLSGFLAVVLAGGWQTQVVADLCIALGLFTLWMVGDARRHRIPVWPYLIAICWIGSIAPLAYLTHREWRRSKSSVAA